MTERIRKAVLREKITSAEEAARLIPDNAVVGVGGYTSAGCPKATLCALAAAHQDDGFHISVVSGSTIGTLDTMLAEAGILERRTPMIESRELSAQINAGCVAYVEQQMGRMPRLLAQEAFGTLDVVIVEATAITEEGYLIPTTAVGMAPTLLAHAKRIIVEVNTAQPLWLEGMHDIYSPRPNEPIPLCHVSERIGEPYIRVDNSRIAAIVLTDKPDEIKKSPPATQQQRQITENLLSFLEGECSRRRWYELPPLQTGFGSLAAEIAASLGWSDLGAVRVFCGGAQEESLLLTEKGRTATISCGSIQLTEAVASLLERDPSARGRVLLRNGEITNSGEVISRMGLIALNSGIEADIYGNVNASHIAGSKVVNGLGGGAGFAENAALSILLLPAESKGGAISNIVPMVTHQDIGEHDVDVLITEYGVADLRGLSDVERAHTIIDNCAGSYKTALSDYLRRAEAMGGHHPVILREAFSWHLRLAEKGTMKE